jgi:hypothetical protein
MKSRHMRPVAVVLSMVAASLAQANPEFSVSGFGTVGAARTSDANVEYVQSAQPTGAGTKWSMEPDSRIGAQVDAKFDPVFSATMQVLSKYNGEGSYRPGVEWLFAKARLGEGFSVRVGRIGAPYFAVSDFREVGFASVWLRAPADVYGLVPLRSFDGVDVQYSGKVGEVPVTVQVLAGNSKIVNVRDPAHFRNQVGLNVTAEIAEGVSIRAGTIQGKFTATNALVAQLVGTLRTTPWGSVGDQIDCNASRAGFSGLGLSLDRGNWVGAAEYTHRNSKCILGNSTGWLLMAGYRINAFTPYVSLSGVKSGASAVDNTVPVGIAPEVDFIHSIVNLAVESLNPKQKTVSFGVRWDAARNVAIKAQFDRIDPMGGAGINPPNLSEAR